ncbi:MarR family winged helix-turn-helix transcriptional regulator [Paraburkholderia sp. J12]|uniref:MarR family winged helix-turn-helix transcriptional regulator n=1 Tax=Paraburkholderia sp. J12 TaxID=2805432 RepID=UPI002ABE39A5|nr:MarR family winged helix-turn-helix transcriptional regulator [Paraburkholderia sp. J12]
MTERLENLLGVLALLIVDDLQAAGEEETDAAGLTARSILNAVHMYPGCTIEELRTAVGLSHPATVRAVAGLVEADLVKKVPGADRRAVSLTLTAAGRRVVDRTLANRNAILERLTRHLNARERQQLDALLLKMLWSETRDPAHAMQLCRLCDEAPCLAAGCPVECRSEGLPMPAGRAK